MTAPTLPTARHIELRLQRLDTGEIRVSTPQARGWARCARGPYQVWSAIDEAFAQATAAGRARWRGEVPELDALTEVDDPSEPARQAMPTADELAARRGGDGAALVSYGKNRLVRPDQSSPSEWTPNADGSWTSPGGRRWTSQKVLIPLVIRRARMGLSATYAEWLAEQDGAKVG